MSTLICASLNEQGCLDQTWLGVRCHSEGEFKPLLFAHNWTIQGPEIVTNSKKYVLIVNVKVCDFADTMVIVVQINLI